MNKPKINLTNVKNIHFIGIGGSGMFPMAKILKSKGFNISGSDISESETLEKVRECQIPLVVGHKKENIQNFDLVVYSTAIKQMSKKTGELNPEIAEAEAKGIPLVERSEMLGLLASEYENLIAVAGTHGKTSTTAMITTILLGAKKDPTALIGGMLSKLGGNACTGNSDIMVCEACEYVDSFLQLYPKISVISNVDADHLDYFGTFENMKKSFSKFAAQTSGLLIVNGDDENSRECVKNASSNTVFYGFNRNNDYSAQNIIFSKRQFADFDVFKGSEKIGHISLSVPGKHNVYNALAAFIVCTQVGVSADEIEYALKNFTGVHRRFEILGEVGGITIVDDYAHHPTEIETTLSAAMKMNFNKVTAIFQPHNFSRTSMLLDEFAKVLSIADEMILTEIYATREINTYNIYAEDLAEKIKGSKYFKTFEEICEYVITNARSGDLILTMGAGDIYKCANMIMKKLDLIYSKK